MKQSTIDFLKTLADGEDPQTGMPVFGIEHAGMFIYDPYTSSCGRFDAKPSDYGLTKESADLLVGLNNLIDESAEAAINAASLRVNSKLGIFKGLGFFRGNVMTLPDGAVASAISSAFNRDALKIALARTLRAQIRNEVCPADVNDEAEADLENSSSASTPRPNRPQV